MPKRSGAAMRFCAPTTMETTSEGWHLWSQIYQISHWGADGGYTKKGGWWLLMWWLVVDVGMWVGCWCGLVGGDVWLLGWVVEWFLGCFLCCLGRLIFFVKKACEFRGNFHSPLRLERFMEGNSTTSRQQAGNSTYLEDRSRYKPRFPKTTPGTPRPSIYTCLFQLDDDSKSLKKKMVGNHHFHPSLNGWPWGSRLTPPLKTNVHVTWKVMMVGRLFSQNLVMIPF